MFFACINVDCVNIRVRPSEHTIELVRCGVKSKHDGRVILKPGTLRKLITELNKLVVLDMPDRKVRVFTFIFCSLLLLRDNLYIPAMPDLQSRRLVSQETIRVPGICRILISRISFGRIFLDRLQDPFFCSKKRGTSRLSTTPEGGC